MLLENKEMGIARRGVERERTGGKWEKEGD
jgi:hypothetical protein